MKRIAVGLIVGTVTFGIGFTVASSTRGTSVTAASTTTTTVPGATTVPLAPSPLTVPATEVTVDTPVPPEVPVPPTIPLEDTPLVDAVHACVGDDAIDIDNGLYYVAFTIIALHDGGHSLALNQERTFDVFNCVRGELGLPEWPYELMKSTASQFGLVTVDLAGGYSLRWAYHPDNGALVGTER